jgi:nucleoside-diphosphate-sugar epimerase
VAKLYAECHHRALPGLSIVDIRVFNYFSHTQDMEARFFITDIVRAIRDKTVLKTSTDYIVRDYLHPNDFHQIINCILLHAHANLALDCYSQAPVDKATLLQAMKEAFGLQYEEWPSAAHVNATGIKPHYYSMNRKSEELGYTPTLNSLQGVQREVIEYFRLLTSIEI